MITFNLRHSDMQNNTSYPFYESEVPVSMWKIYVQGFLAMFIVISGFNLVLSALLFFPWNAVNTALQGSLELPFWTCFGGLWALELLLFFLIILAPKPPSDGIEYPFESKEGLFVYRY